MGASLSASSMRMDPISVPLIRGIGRDRRQNLTVAPEAGSQRLRNVINKTQTEDQMMAAISLAQEYDFPQLKLYFMVGHPTETRRRHPGASSTSCSTLASVSSAALPSTPPPLCRKRTHRSSGRR